MIALAKIEGWSCARKRLVAIFNRLFPSSKVPRFQNEAKCKTFQMEMSFIWMRIEKYFHNKDFALTLVLKTRLSATRK